MTTDTCKHTGGIDYESRQVAATTLHDFTCVQCRIEARITASIAEFIEPDEARD